MPELPEVETTVRQIAPRLVGRRVLDFQSHWKRNCSPTAAGVRAALRGRTITSLNRRAKYIVASLDDQSHFLVHLRMSGRLQWAGEPDDSPTHVRAHWALDNGDRLLFCDARKFGRIVHTRDLVATTAELGIEPLSEDFSIAVLRGLLRARARRMKPLLLDQSIIAGIGNIYADEALFAARIHPLARSDRLSTRQIGNLRTAIRTVLERGIANNGASIDWVYPGGTMQEVLAVYGRDGEPCPRCKATILALRVGQRGTHVCPRCQRAPRGE